ncbi:MAG: hydrogenase expression/formation protein HypE, partial [Nitrososphaeria archaeon]
MSGNEDVVRMAHGGGGKLTHALIESTFLPAFRNKILERMEDSAVLPRRGRRIAFTTDSYTVKPLFFPGGDLGKLAINGTINDLAMQGGVIKPSMSCAFIIEEGLSFDLLRKIVESMKRAAEEADTQVVAGDTKVVERGAADQIYVSTSGVALVPRGLQVGAEHVCVGDAVLVSGPVGDHGATVLASRFDLKMREDFKSDCASLREMVIDLTSRKIEVHCMRDPTRGGLATTLNEIASKRGVRIEVDETSIPVRPEVSALCEILGLDPLYLACEGRMVCFTPWESRNEALESMKSLSTGSGAALIGRVIGEGQRVVAKTAVGSHRILSMYLGE